MSIPSTVLSRIGIPLLAALAGFGFAQALTPNPAAEELMMRLERQDARMEALARRLETQAASPPVAPSPRATVGMDLSALRGELRELLREELRTAIASVDDSPVLEKAPAPPPPPTPENVAAFEKVDRMVEDSLASGSWGRAQIQELRMLRRQMTDAQYMELVRKLLTAINSQQLRVEERGSPI
ncbi:hypothetical protein [Myxococcus qinghaiensis]|uniref:hypothetical protein n=1 Tax=Myxococcus qinghaiensis TaxID=2906758 RepID=UPI0020A6F495|nr:hypothetical protein [Myxococcus qinghaiensis]MCP3165619.1 hypothetical protein [Myxococcus qinghaiensis]